MEHSVFLARQPIFDKRGDIAAYELFYRDSVENTAQVGDNLHATARTLVNALNYIGLKTVTEGHVAFIKVDDKILTGDIIQSIAPSHFVLEILESTVVSSELVAHIETLHKRGYRFALNHYHLDNNFLLHFKALLKIVDYVKVDIAEFDNLPAVLSELRGYGFKLIAEKIETPEHYNRAVSQGFDYVQGYYFSHPDLFKRERIEPQLNLLLELIHLLKGNAGTDLLIEQINSSPFLLVNLLKFIHLHEGMPHDTIGSAEQALVIVGRDRLLHWLELMVYAHDEGSDDNLTRSLSQRARHRACLMEELALKEGKSPAFAHSAYMAGLLSMFEPIFGSGFAELLKQAHVDRKVAEALVKKNGDLGQLIQLATAIERNDLRTLNSIIGQLQLSQRELNEAMMASYRRSAEPVQ